ncbi:hypothetical protein [Flavobacterium ardleyense]|uniref:hypothetical protein n=1 Tax=Flavobacterium ardleyense TaxID=2038737 RepID=UPI00298D3A09|nr:hypothetical protein [Flavobacterium ardleyense]
MHYLLTGISVLIIATLFTSCEKGEIDERRTATYIYQNTSDRNLIMKVYDTNRDLSEQYSINAGESKEIISVGKPITAPFYSIQSNFVGDSLVLVFEDNKCLTFTREINNGVGVNGGTGPFNLKNYDDYNTDVINRKNYTLHYTIGLDLYDQAIDCN